MRRFALSVTSSIGIGVFSVPSFAADGFYLGLGTAYNAINGDFDGNRSFDSSANGSSNNVPPTLLIVPKMDKAVGWSALGGYSRGHYALELSYAASAHDSQWNDIKFDTDYSVVDFDLKYFFIVRQPLRPYVLVGVNFDQVKVKGGAANILGTDDARYYGGGFNVGTGAEYFLTDHISIGFNAKYRLVKYNEAIAVSTHWQLENKLAGNGYSMMLTTTYHW